MGLLGPSQRPSKDLLHACIHPVWAWEPEGDQGKAFPLWRPAHSLKGTCRLDHFIF